MPAKLPFFDPSESLQQRWREATSPTRVSAQIYVFLLLITIGLLRQYLFPANKTDHTYGSVEASLEPGSKDETLGEIVEIFIYPVKSCAGVSVSTAQLTQQGFDLDRRWMVVRTAVDGKLEKMNLKAEPRLTLIQPVIDEEANTLSLRLTPVGQKQATARDLGETDTVLRPTSFQLQTWRQVPRIEMYGDYASGRVARLADPTTRKLNPSEWLTQFLGYPVLLVHFDTTSTTTRDAFPIFKPPTDSRTWSAHDRSELYRKRGIEFQDEYPLLVASQESLAFVRAQLSDALAASDSDGRGGRPISLDSKWTDSTTLSMARFRPNLVVKGKTALAAFSEDSWERIWILPPSAAAADSAKAMLQLVARCERCLLTAVDPISAEKDPSVPLKLLNRSRMRVKKVAGIQGGTGRAGPCFGMYAVPLPLHLGSQETTYGSLEQGDAIRVRWRPFDSDDEPDRQR